MYKNDNRFVQTSTGYVTMKKEKDVWVWAMLLLNVMLIVIIAWALGNLR